MPTEKREWSLTKSPNGENAIKVRQCPHCYKIYEPKTRQCPYCNYMAEPTPREIKQEEQAELERIKKVEKYQRKNEIWQCKTYGELVAYAREHNYKNPGGWAYYILQARKKKGKK